jgi:hypothetical protein
MAITYTERADSFNQFRLNTNDLADDLGDLTTLDTTDKTSMVAAVNEVKSGVSDSAIVMAIALG